MDLSNKSKFSLENNLEVCRLCLSLTKTCFSLIENSEASGMLEALTSLKILPSDDISRIMCLKCSLNLKLAFTIQQNMLKAEQRFRENTFLTPIKQECDVQNVESDEKCVEKTEVHETKGIKSDQKKCSVNEYTCKVCDKKCSSKNDLGKHDVHIVDCPLCGKKYKKKSLKYHIKEMHDTKSEQADLKKYVCGICGEARTTKKRLGKHKRVHVIFKCATCNKKFAKPQVKENVGKHISNAVVAESVKNVLENYTCEICGKECSSKSLLNHHKDCVHSKGKDSVCEKNSEAHLKEHVAHHGVSSAQESNPDGAQKEPNADSAGKYSCDIFGKIKFSQADLKKRKDNVHVPTRCPPCEEMISQANTQHHIDTHNDSHTMCELCGISVLQRDFTVHMYKVHKVRKLKCKFCDKIFNRTYLRAMHENIHHLGQEDFTSNTCRKSVFKKRCLKTHNDSTDLKLKPQICEFCNAGFSSKIGLITHRRQHTNESPYKCEFCGEGFRQNVSLKSHLKFQHDIKKDLNLECKECGKTFSSNVAMLSHSRVHIFRTLLQSIQLIQRLIHMRHELDRIIQRRYKTRKSPRKVGQPVDINIEPLHKI